EGVDSEWVVAGARRTAHYNNIYPGHYHFRVLACNSDGVWSENGAALDFELLPHFWQTWSFLIGSALAAGASLYGLALLATRRRMQRKLELLERQHAIERERGRIAKDIHDDLGSSLTRIMMLGERTEESLANGEEAAIHARKIVASARATVQ